MQAGPEDAPAEQEQVQVERPGPPARRSAAQSRAGRASRRILRRCLPVVVHRPPRSGVSPSRSLVRGRNSSRSEDETGRARLGAGRMPGQAEPGARQPEQYASDHGFGQIPGKRRRDSGTSRFDARRAGPLLGPLHVQKPVDGRARALAIVEVGQRREAAQNQRADQQGDGPRPVDLTQFGGGLGAVENGVERRSWLLYEALRSAPLDEAIEFRRKCRDAYTEVARSMQWESQF